MSFFESSAKQGQGKPAAAKPSAQDRPSVPADADEVLESGNASAIAAARYALPLTDGETDQELTDADEAEPGESDLPSIRTNGASSLAAVQASTFVKECV